jgi:amino acid permease
MDEQDNDKPLTFREMLQSVLAAAFGVQSGKNRARDFSRGKPSHFILLGVLFTSIFVLVLFVLVKLVLHLAGA